MSEDKEESKMNKPTLQYNKELVEEMIAHCPTLDVIDCIGLIEMINQYTAVTNSSKGIK